MARLTEESSNPSSREELGNFEAVVVGATPGGILTAVRAARKGVKVLLISYYEHIGGNPSNGLSSWDSTYEGNRSPLVEEWLESVRNHYRSTYGATSTEYQECIKGPFSAEQYGHIMYEPHVAEQIFERLVAGESNLSLVRGYYPVAAERYGRKIRALWFRTFKQKPLIEYRAFSLIFVDATYEGDVAALAGVEYRVGRESRTEFNEQHAGKIFVARDTPESHYPLRGDMERLRYPREARAGRLNIRPHWGTNHEIFSGSTGEADSGVQNYNFRVTLSRDPKNRRAVTKPSNYDRDRYLPLSNPQGEFEEPKIYPLKTDLLVAPLLDLPCMIPVPNQKCDWNAGAIPGGANEYPDGSWETRGRVMQDHRQLALGMLYFLQNDESISADIRKKIGVWGLPKDEYVDNDNFPREIYVREARRIRGRKIFTENDARIPTGLSRTPIHSDSIAITEWFMDSHDCSPDRVMGSMGDGFVSLPELTRPAQVPLSILFPRDLDNLIVSVCMSSTHIGWGTLRLEPVWMHVGDSVGFLVAMAIQNGIDPTNVKPAELQRSLVESGIMISFFNDFDMATKEEWVAAMQFLGAKGFFRDYDARPNDQLDLSTAKCWARTFGAMLDDRDADPCRYASTLPKGVPSDQEPIAASRLFELISRELEYREISRDAIRKTYAEMHWRHSETISRGEAAIYIYRALGVLEIATERTERL
jgi:hypothetical protein